MLNRDNLIDIALHTAAALVLYGVLMGFAAIAKDLAIAIAISGGLYVREVTQLQKARNLSFLKGWLLGGSLSKHLEWTVPTAILLAIVFAV